jgi:hypothetical protein
MRHPRDASLVAVQMPCSPNSVCRAVVR